MSKEHFDNIKAQIEAIPETEVEAPNMPIDNFIQEAFDLYEWAKDHKKALVQAGLEAELLDTLSDRAAALRYAQSVWNKQRNSRKEAQKEWNIKSVEAREFKSDLEADFRFAFRKDERLISKVKKIEEGHSNADMIQDLQDLAVLGSDNKDLLKKISFDLSQLEKAATLSTELGQLLAQVNGDRAEGNVEKVLRDRVYVYAKKAISEIRDTGRYVFRKDKQKLKGYQLKYFG